MPEEDGVEGGADQGDEATENEGSAQVLGHGSSRGYPDSPSARDSPNPATTGWAANPLRRAILPFLTPVFLTHGILNHQFSCKFGHVTLNLSIYYYGDFPGGSVVKKKIHLPMQREAGQ